MSRRREFIALIDGAAAWPLTALAQQRRLPRIGVLVLGNPDPESFLRVFQDGLRELGYSVGQNIFAPCGLRFPDEVIE